MPSDSSSLENRVASLERSLGRMRRTAWGLNLGLVATVAMAFTGRGRMPDEIRTHRIVVVDDEGRPRIVLAQDPVNTQRISRSAGLVLLDDKGSERGGFTTMADGSVVIGLDAPRGVGAPMPDRIGLKVYSDGSAHVMLIDNQTRAVARLESDGMTGGVKVFKWDMAHNWVHTRLLTFDGEVRDSTPVGQ